MWLKNEARWETGIEQHDREEASREAKSSRTTMEFSCGCATIEDMMTCTGHGPVKKGSTDTQATASERATVPKRKKSGHRGN